MPDSIPKCPAVRPSVTPARRNAVGDGCRDSVGGYGVTVAITSPLAPSTMSIVTVPATPNFVFPSRTPLVIFRHYIMRMPSGMACIGKPFIVTRPLSGAGH